MRVLLLEEKVNGLEFVVQHLRGVGGMSFMLAKDISEIEPFVFKQHYDFCFVCLNGDYIPKLDYIKSVLHPETILILALDDDDSVITDIVDDVITASTKGERLYRLVGLSIMQKKHQACPQKFEMVKSLREIRQITSYQNVVMAGKA